jgi:hypothetical protein
LVKFRVQVLDYSNHTPVSNASVSLSDGASHMDDHTDAVGLTRVFSLPKSNQTNLALSVRAGNYTSRSFNLDRLQRMKPTPPNWSLWEQAQGIGLPANRLRLQSQGHGRCRVWAIRIMNASRAEAFPLQSTERARQ